MSHARKALVARTLHEFPEPTENQEVVRIVENRGAYLYTVEVRLHASIAARCRQCPLRSLPSAESLFLWPNVCTAVSSFPSC